MNKRKIVDVVTGLSTALATVGIPLAAHADWLDTSCDPSPKWTSFVPNQGRLEVFEMSGKRYIFTGFEWTAAKNLSWFATHDFPTLEVESVVSGYGEKVIDLGIAPDEPIFVNYSVMPCRYMDTDVLDNLPTLTEGSACAGHFTHSKLYYSLTMIKTPEDPDLAESGDLLAFRFQAGRWAPWHPAVIVNPLAGTLHCLSQAKSAAEDMEDYWSARWCTAACETNNPEKSGTYIILGTDKPEFSDDEFKLPICVDWTFDSVTGVSGYNYCKSGENTCPAGAGLYCGNPSLDQDPDTLYYCDGGVYDDAQLCMAGCIVAPAGENDYCDGGQGACPSGDGLYCGESVGLAAGTLYQCVGGDYTAIQTCNYGCVNAGPGDDDYCSSEPAACPSGDGLYCGESVGLAAGTLYQCIGGDYTELQVCNDGCVTAGPGNDDYCAPGGACPSGDGLYCGESVGLTSGTLYLCEGGGYSVSEVCADVCVDAGPGNDDYCGNAPCTDIYTVTDYKCNVFTSANGLGPGGGEIIEVCGLVDLQGKVTVKARKFDGTNFSDRPYQVRVSPPQDAPCGPDTYIYKISNVAQPGGIGTSELSFEFDSIWEMGQWEKGYCVTASTKPGDPGYDGSDQQTSWWYSDKFTLERTCN